MQELGAQDAHNVRLIGREALEITGVERVTSFDVKAFELVTTSGNLYIEGDSLHMKQFDVKAGIVRIEGHIVALQYADETKRKGFARRLLR
ncbi:YabP/YqfC family sporulation protein [Alicyclobacillus fastidiosus]|nr:YabP/YqfC family sporulation protein [Alicyclobacillus fastidiosus]WEH11951.1 YabP/YqfC family sporulation protein [Alicyclobacillus fastidiosus]